ncbi:MAG TPA: tetratricopeptide repeat protein [bacterium]|nr:tetratricopeptide repeat protein [bacterium]
MARSLLDIDSLINESTELAALGRHNDAALGFRQALSGLEDRFRGAAGQLPVDIIERRFRLLLRLARAHIDGDSPLKAIPCATEAMAIARGPFSDYPEFFLRAAFELGSSYLASGDTAAAKSIITESAKVSRSTSADSSALPQMLSALAVGRLFAAEGKSAPAIAAFEHGVKSSPEPTDVETALVKSDLLLSLGDAVSRLSMADKAFQSYIEAVSTLRNSGIEAIKNNKSLDAAVLLASARKIFQKLPNTAECVAARIDSDISLASILDMRGRWEEADKLCREAAELLQRTGVSHPRGAALARIGMGTFLTHMKKYEDAAVELSRAVEIAEKNNDIFALCVAQYNLGLALSKRGSDEKGTKLFEEALDMLSTSLPDDADAKRLMALIRNQLGFISARARRFDAAVEHFQQSIELLRNRPADTAIGETYRLLGEIYSERGQNMQSERALKKALKTFEDAGAVYETARTFRSIGVNFLSTGELDKAIYFLDESISLLEKLGIEAELPMAYSTKAKACVMMEEYAQAESLFTKDFNIAKKSENKHSLAFSYFHLARIRRLLGRSHTAEDFLKRSLDLFNEVNNREMAALTMLEMALCASARRDTKTATDLCAKAQSVFEASKNQENIACELLTRGIVLREAKRRQMARRCYEDCIRIHEKLNPAALELAEAHFEFAMFWREESDKKSATRHILNAIEITEKLGLTKKLSKYLAALNDINPEAGAGMRLSRIMGKSGAEQMIKTKDEDKLTVEQKNLTVFFTDIRGFTTISETLSLEELNSFLNDFYTSVTQVIIRFGGLINKFIGDEVMALFNIDGALEDHPARALKAAVELVRTMGEVNMIRERRGETPIHLGIGVNCGDVLIGTFGSSLRQDYTAIGDTVNTAARLQAKAGPGEIVVSQKVYDAASDVIAEAEDMGEIPLKGKDRAARLWKIKALKEEATREGQ